MKITDIKKGQKLYDRTDGSVLTVKALGDKTVLVEAHRTLHDTEGKPVIEKVELSYPPEELSDHREYPEIVVNIYRSNPFQASAEHVPCRSFVGDERAMRDPEFHRVIAQMKLTKTGMVYLSEMP